MWVFADVNDAAFMVPAMLAFPPSFPYINKCRYACGRTDDGGLFSSVFHVTNAATPQIPPGGFPMSPTPPPPSFIYIEAAKSIIICMTV